MFLSTNLMEYEKDPDKIYVTANRNKVVHVSTAGRYQQLASSQEEADTKMILHAVDVGATKIDIHLRIESYFSAFH